MSESVAADFSIAADFQSDPLRRVCNPTQLNMRICNPKTCCSNFVASDLQSDAVEYEDL